MALWAQGKPLRTIPTPCGRKGLKISHEGVVGVLRPLALQREGIDAATLSRICSPVISRSNWAKDSSMLRVSRPMLVVVLKAWVNEMKETPCASNSSTSLAKLQATASEIVHQDLDARVSSRELLGDRRLAEVAGKADHVPPVVDRRSPTAALTAACDRPLTIARAPSRARAVAMARPMPAVLPLISAVLPFSWRSMGFPFNEASGWGRAFLRATRPLPS